MSPGWHSSSQAALRASPAPFPSALVTPNCVLLERQQVNWLLSDRREQCLTYNRAALSAHSTTLLTQARDPETYQDEGTDADGRGAAGLPGGGGSPSRRRCRAAAAGAGQGPRSQGCARSQGRACGCG